MVGGRGADLCLGTPVQIGASSGPARVQILLQTTVIYAVQSDTSLLHLPTVKQGLLVTNGPHIHGISAPRDPALIGRPLALIHPFLAAQVGGDKSS